MHHVLTLFFVQGVTFDVCAKGCSWKAATTIAFLVPSVVCLDPVTSQPRSSVLVYPRSPYKNVVHRRRICRPTLLDGDVAVLVCAVSFQLRTSMVVYREASPEAHGLEVRGGRCAACVQRRQQVSLQVGRRPQDLNSLPSAAARTWGA